MLTSTASLISLVSKTHMMSHFTLSWCIVLNIARNPLSCDLPRTTFGKVTVEVIGLVIAKGAYSLFKNGYLSIIPCQLPKTVNGHQDMGERIWAIPYDHQGKILVKRKLSIKLKEHFSKLWISNWINCQILPKNENLGCKFFYFEYVAMIRSMNIF